MYFTSFIKHLFILNVLTCSVDILTMNNLYRNPQTISEFYCDGRKNNDYERYQHTKLFFFFFHRTVFK